LIEEEIRPEKTKKSEKAEETRSGQLSSAPKGRPCESSGRTSVRDMEPFGRDPAEKTTGREPLPSLQQKDLAAKAAKIRDACRRKDVEALRALSTSAGGLVSDDVRRQACSCHPETPPYPD